MSSELGWSPRLPNTSNLNSDTTTTKHRQVMSLIDTNKSCLKQSERESQRVRLRLHCPTERAAGLYETARLARRSTLSWCHVSPLLISHNKAPFNKSHIIGRIFVVRYHSDFCKGKISRHALPSIQRSIGTALVDRIWRFLRLGLLSPLNLKHSRNTLAVQNLEC